MILSNKKNFKTGILIIPAKYIVFLFLLFFIINGASAQSGFPNEDYWSLDAGIGMSDILVKGGSFNVIIDPKLWLSPPFMIGSRFGIDYSFNEDDGRNIFSLETQAYLRWNFLRIGNPSNKLNIFAQAGVGVLASYRGNKEEPDKLFKDVTMTRGSVLAEAAVGVTIPFTQRFHIEPSIRTGFPHIWGFNVTAGFKFPKSRRTFYEESLIDRGTAESGTGASVSGTGTSVSGTGSVSATGSAASGTGTSVPGTGSAASATGTSVSGTGTSVPGTGSAASATGSAASATGTSVPGTGSAASATGSAASATGTSVQGTGSVSATGTAASGTGTSAASSGTAAFGTGTSVTGTGSSISEFSTGTVSGFAAVTGQEQVRIEYVEVIRILPPVEIVKRIMISAVEFILFGPNTGRYNAGIDRDAESLNELVLDSVAQKLNENPNILVRIEGHANPVTNDPNEADELMLLSSLRSSTVAEQLKNRGVRDEQIVTIAFGGTRTVTSDHDIWNRNRRVELILVEIDIR